MINDLARDLIKLHFEAANTLAEYLPPRIKDGMIAVQKDIAEIAGEYAGAQDKAAKASKSIPID